MKLSDLTPHPGNPRKIDSKKLEMLEKSLKEFGDLSGIIFNRSTGRLIGGHQRLKLLPRDAEIHKTDENHGFVLIEGDRFQYREVDWDETKERAANIAANQHGGEWDFPQLTDWIMDLDQHNIDMDLLGFDREELEDLMAPVGIKQGQCDEDEIPEKVPAKTQIGDIYQLGDHRLMCGDSNSIDLVDKLMAGERAPIVFMDPPYNLKEHGQTKRTNKTESKTVEFGDWDVGFNPADALSVMTLATTEDSHRFICTSSWLFGKIHDWLERAGEKPNYLVWSKNNPMPSLSMSSFLQASELIIHSRRGSPVFNYPEGQNLPNVFRGNVEAHEFGHPTQKPIYVIEYCLAPTEGDVLDLFGGSGSTMIACEKTNRRCFMMEIDPHYCDVIVARWEKYTGKQAKLLNGKTKS